VKDYIIYFLVGGAYTAVIIGLEQSQHRLLSVFATLVPVFTVVAYFFIGATKGGAAVSQHAWLVLIGTLVAWVPYMIVVAVLAPKIGAGKAIPAGLGVFLALALVYTGIVSYYKLFQ
jgi:uncharacterized membrane protein (GlpM family)